MATRARCGLLNQTFDQDEDRGDDEEEDDDDEEFPATGGKAEL